MRNSHVVLLKGERRSFPVNFDPINSIRGDYSWTLSDPNVATIASHFNSGCAVIGNAAGTTTLTVNVGNVQASCDITVLDTDSMNPLSPGDQHVLNLASGETRWYRFEAAEDGEYTFWDGSRDQLRYDSLITCWKISQSGMFKFFEGGGIIPVDAKSGETFIFCVKNRWSTPYTCNIHLEKNVPAESVSLLRDTYTLLAGSTNYTSVTPQFVPVNSIRSDMTWSVEDPSVVQIYRSHPNACEILPGQTGTTTLTGTIGDKSVSCRVQVVQQEPFAAGEVKPIQLDPGETIIYRFDPTSTAQYTLWNERGFNGYYFTILEGNRQINNGNCPAAFSAQTGTPYFIHVRNEGTETATYEMHLEENVPMVSVSMDTERSVPQGGGGFVTLNYTPFNSIRGAVAWYADDYTVVKLGSCFDGGCNFEAVGLGTATLTAVVAGQTLTCEITVSCNHENVSNDACPDCGDKTGVCGDNLRWTLDSEGKLVIWGTSPMAEYTWNEVPWSPYKNEIKTVVVEDGVESICGWAFFECQNLTAVTLPDSITSIGTGAFRFCDSLKTVDLPDGLTEIASNLFSGCDGLESIVIPSGVTVIGESAFNGCTGLKSIVIPASVTSLEKWALSACLSMTEMEFLGDAPTITEDAFTYINATAIYPASNPTWTSDKLRNYGGTIEWLVWSAPGDANADCKVDTTDALQLLWHALLGEEYPLTGSGDVTGDGRVTVEDAAYVVWHTLFPELYPLT